MILFVENEYCNESTFVYSFYIFFFFSLVDICCMTALLITLFLQAEKKSDQKQTFIATVSHEVCMSTVIYYSLPEVIAYCATEQHTEIDENCELWQNDQVLGLNSSACDK